MLWMKFTDDAEWRLRRFLKMSLTELSLSGSSQVADTSQGRDAAGPA
jgi:hypothetical protein